MFGIVNSNPIRLQTIQELITAALANYLQKSGGEVTGPITGSNGTSSVDLTNGINVTKTGDAESQELGGNITDSVHTTYYGLQLDSTDEATDDYGSVKITPEYVQTNSGATTYEKLASDSYDLEVGNQQIIHYDATNGLQLSNVATPVSNSDVSTKGYTDSTIDSKISDALSSGGAIDDAIDDAISNLGDTYLPKSGGTMTGNLTLVGSPSTDNMAATKKYVDDSIIASGGVVVDTQISSTSENPVQNKVIKSALDEKVDIVQGKGLSTNDYTDADKQKLSGVDTGAEVNVIDAITVNGTSTTVINKTVDIGVPSNTSDLTNDSNFVSDANYVHTDNNFTTSDKDKLSGIETGAEANVLEGIKVNGTDATITNKVASISVPIVDPTLDGTSSNAVENQAVYNELQDRVNLNGDTMKGDLTLYRNPTNNLHAATKQYVDDATSSVSTTVQTQIDTKSNKPTQVKMTLLSSGWDSNTNTYSFETTYPSATYDISLEPNGATITEAQFEAWSQAQILGNPDSNVIKSLGSVPTVDIPIVLTVTEK